MKRLCVTEIVAGFFLGFAALLVIIVLNSEHAAHYEICESTKEGAKECASYNVMLFAIRKVGNALDSYNGLITAAATVAIAWFTFSLREATNRLWDAGERQLDVSEQTLIAGQRAWIRVDVEISGDLVFDANGNAPLKMVWTLTNKGNSPATNVRINPNLLLEHPHQKPMLVAYREFCAAVRLRAQMPIHDLNSYTLFPDETKEIPFFETINSEQIREAAMAWRERTGQDWGHFKPFVVGCITYRIPFDDKQHQTGFLFEVRRRIPNVAPERQWGMFTIGEQTVPLGEMRLLHSYWGSPSID